MSRTNRFTSMHEEFQNQHAIVSANNDSPRSRSSTFVGLTNRLLALQFESWGDVEIPEQGSKHFLQEGVRPALLEQSAGSESLGVAGYGRQDPSYLRSTPNLADAGNGPHRAAADVGLSAKPRDGGSIDRRYRCALRSERGRPANPCRRGR